MSHGKQTPNIGQYGVASMRFSGMAVDDLPIAEAASAKMQLPKALEAERQAVIDGIRARYPTQSVDYIKARIREAKGNISKFRGEQTRIGSDRDEYRILLHDAEQREEQIEAAQVQLTGEALEAKIKELTDRYGPWRVEGLQTQLELFEASLDRFDRVILQEQEAIDEMVELLGQCRARDKELARVGA